MLMPRTISKLASFLGDPNFPEVAIQSTRGGKIRLYQDLYIQYSRLNFTRISDRAIAIAGLEKRLIHDLKTYGGFGVLDDGLGLLHRSLLWQRGSEESTMDRIVFPADRQMMMIPTWSWMAYKGGIDYLDLPFDGVDWDEQIRSPWNPGSREVWHTGDQAGIVELSAIARDFDFTGTTGPESKLIYDIPGRSSGPSQSVKCVVVGRLKNSGQNERNKMHYVLLVSPISSQVTRGGQVCERVGVGQVLGRWIKLDPPGTPVKIR
jgi:hypothetical protein